MTAGLFGRYLEKLTGPYVPLSRQRLQDKLMHTREDNERDAMNLAEMLRTLYDMPQMTLALVQGAAMGGGAGLVAACDVAVAMKGTKFRFSEARLGLTEHVLEGQQGKFGILEGRCVEEIASAKALAQDRCFLA